MLAPDVKAPVGELAAYPIDPVERQLHVDVVHGGHDRQIALARGYGFVVDARAGQVQQTRLVRDRQGMVTVDHRFALVSLERPRGPGQKTVLHCQLAEHGDSAVEQLALPLRDHVGVHVESLGDRDQRLLALEGLQCHLGLEDRCVVASRSSRHGRYSSSVSSPRSSIIT